MDFEIPANLQELQRQVRAFTRDKLSPFEQAYLQHQQVDMKAVQAEIKKAGFWAGCVGKAQGGQGLSWLAQVMVEEELGKCALPLATGNEPGVFFLVACDAKALLEPIAKGEKNVCFALSEAQSGSDIDAMKTTITAKGDTLEINGSKSYVAGADLADQIVVVGKKGGVEGNAPMVACVVDRNAAGVQIGKATELFDGSKVFEITFNACSVPAANAVGSAAGVAAQVEKTMQRWNASVAAKALGMAKRAVEIMSADCSKKRTFGSKLSDNEAIQFKLADSSVVTENAMYALYAAAATMDHGTDFSKEIAAAKVVATHAATRAIDEAIQVCGANGLSSDMPLTAMYKKARQLQLEAVPTEIVKRGLVFSMYKGNYLLGGVIN